MGVTPTKPKQQPDMRAVHKKLYGCEDLLTKREAHLQEQIDGKEEALRRLASQSKDPHVRARCLMLLRERRMLMAAHKNTQAKRGHAEELKLIVEEVDVNKTYLEVMDSVAASFRGQGIGSLLDASSKNMQELGDSVADLESLAAELRTPLGTANISDEDLEAELCAFLGEEAPGTLAQGGDNGSASSPGLLSPGAASASVVSALSATAPSSASSLSATSPTTLASLPRTPTAPVTMHPPPPQRAQSVTPMTSTRPSAGGMATMTRTAAPARMRPAADAAAMAFGGDG